MNKVTGIESTKGKIDQLNREAWDIRVNGSPRAFELSQVSLGMAREIGYQRGIAEASRSLGFCYVRLSNYDEAMPLLTEALAIFETLHDLNGQAVVCEYMAVVHRNRGAFGVALDLLFKALALSQQTGLDEVEAIHHYQLGVTYKYLGDFEKALDSLYTSLTIHRKNNNRQYQSYPLHIIGTIYFENGDYARALEYYKEGLDLRVEFQDKLGEAGSLDSIGFTYLKIKEYSSAIEYCTRSLALSKETGDRRSEASALQHLAEINYHAGNIAKALAFGNQSLEIRKVTGDKRGESEILLFLSGLPQQDANGAMNWILQALKIAMDTGSMDLQSRARYSLYQYHKNLEQFREANEQLELHFSLEKELQKNSINQKMLNLEISQKAAEARKESEAIRLQNESLTKLNHEIREQKIKLEEALADLKATQAQLIQSEKMASLGELTAGIAHEIQNPLNFVNNFSEVSSELLVELKQEIEAGDLAGVRDIADVVIQNLEKILHHGKRADGIVKGMLQHSRTSTGQREPTDINVLADEYLRLAYHGMRAKEKSFNAILNTDYDETIGSVNIIPQDIGRVLLNIIANAFYAVGEKKKNFPDGYEPSISLNTGRNGNNVEISVSDNGTGISKTVVEKIFQPFFTTKPTGHGTGLGLSMSYDIMKAHGGDLRFETNEGTGSIFIISIPMQTK